MTWETMLTHWEGIDIIKIVASIVAGFILGVEREFKDKSAGVKTITIICLGSTLFTILSYKIGAGPSEDATRIASYVVSGIGFLGAGVIFKDGFTVSGLTTASIIWMAAAIGMALGFGEFILAFAFLVGSIIIVYLGNVFNRVVLDQRVAKFLTIEVPKSASHEIQDIHQHILSFVKRAKEKSFHSHENSVTVTYDVFIHVDQLEELKNYLNTHDHITSFEL